MDSRDSLAQFTSLSLTAGCSELLATVSLSSIFIRLELVLGHTVGVAQLYELLTSSKRTSPKVLTSTLIHNMIVAYVIDYKTGQVAGNSTMAARGVGHLRDDDK